MKVFEHRGNTRLGQVDIVPPNQRVRIPLDGSQLANARTYRIVYQDIAANWHETRFVPTYIAVNVWLKGPLRWWHRRIPRGYRRRSFYSEIAGVPGDPRP